MSWPTAFLASIIVMASFSYHYMLISAGIDPIQAVHYLLLIVVPVVALVLPTSVVATGVRAVFRLLSTVLGHLGGGAR
ncbi:hypothetical protein [Nocardia salmonicida]|uniref:hypothetical protein n=1 Tax=Nocardia salmonicida TaxID=53431 RepID=UPI00379A4896